MIYFFSCIILCAVVIWTSFSINVKRKGNDNTVYINMLLFLAPVFGMNALALAAGFWAPAQLASILAQLELLFQALFLGYVCSYLVEISLQNKQIARIVKIIMFISSALFIFAIPGTITHVTINSYEYNYESVEVFSGRIAELISITWFDLFHLIFFIIIPLFCMLMVFVRAENEESKLESQRLIVNGLGVIVFWIILSILKITSYILPMITCVLPIAFIFEILIFYYGSNMDGTWDIKSFVLTLVPILFRFILPAIIIAIVFNLIFTELSEDILIFSIVFIAIIAAIQTVWYQMQKLLDKKKLFRGNDYAKEFEAQLASFTYDDDPKLIAQKVYNIFNQYVDSSSFKLLIDGGVGDLETVYSSDNKNLKIPLSNICFDTLLNLNHSVVFRDYAVNNYNVLNIRSELIKIMDEMDSDAFIILNEGHHIIGVMFLGKKVNGNVYNDYDYESFTKLYSYLFVVGYYMKNIANESVVGTVNREIRMSGQIITSIQENMDRITNPKVDAGYLMVPAHNIGGEFIDMIRLTDTRHIFVIGAMSGKGIAASMSMVILKSVIRTFLAETPDFKLLIEKVNTFIRTGLPKGTFFSGLFGFLDFATDTLYYINCGCQALFLYTRAYNNVIEIQGEGHVLGFAKDIDRLIKVKKVKLAEGDIVLACTDGLIETHSLRGELFGKERTQRSMMDNSLYPSEKMAKFTYDSLAQFTSKEIEDDVSILILKYLGGK